MRTLHRTTFSVICTTLLLVPNPTSSRAQQGPSAPEAAQVDAKRRLLEAADRVETPHFALRAPASPEAVELAHQLEAFAKELQLAWLTRGLDDEPLPADISARLSPEGAAHRKKFVAHLEEMATLTLSDPTPLQRKPGRGEQPNPPGDPGPRRNNPISQARSPIDQQGREDAVESKLSNYVNPVSLRFSIIGIDRGYEMVQTTPEQLALVRKLDRVTEAVLKCWGRKNLDFSTEDGKWPSRALTLRQSIIDLSNRVIFSAIFRPEQAEKLRRALWVKQGPACLLDPEIAERLGIGKGQRAMIQTAMDQSERARLDALAEVMPLINRSDDPLEKRQLGALLKQKRNEFDQAVWDQLTPWQISKLRGLLGERAS